MRHVAAHGLCHPRSLRARVSAVRPRRALAGMPVALVVVLLAVLSPTAAGVVYANTHPIEGYADRLGVVQGGTINFFVHLPAGRTRYSVTYIRYGQNDDALNSAPQQLGAPTTYTNGQEQDYSETA